MPLSLSFYTSLLHLTGFLFSLQPLRVRRRASSFVPLHLFFILFSFRPTRLFQERGPSPLPLVFLILPHFTFAHPPSTSIFLHTYAKKARTHLGCMTSNLLCAFMLGPCLLRCYVFFQGLCLRIPLTSCTAAVVLAWK